MRKLIALPILLLALCAAAFAQVESKPVCPSVSVSGPKELVHPGEKIKVRALLSPNSSDTLTYLWSTSVGEIQFGQNTPAVTIETKDIVGAYEPKGVEITVKLEIDGLPEQCQNIVSEKYYISAGNYDVFPIDEFGALSLNDEKARVDNVATQLNTSKTESALIIIMLALKESKDSAVRRVKRLTDILTTRGRVPLDRFTFAYGERSQTETIIYLLPKDQMDSLLLGYGAKWTLDQLKPAITKPRK